VLILFISILAALGAAVAYRGREVRGLLVLLVACAAALPGEAATGRWNWLGFSLAMCALALAGIVIVRNDPVPAPDDPERDPDWCIPHKKLEPKEER
jgi:hypothetical protein